MLAAHLILLLFVVIFTTAFSFYYYVDTYEIDNDRFEQYLNNLSFPMSFLRKIMRILYSELDRSKVGYPKIARIIMTVILLFMIIPFLIISFNRSQNDDKVYQIIIWGIYIATFMTSWRFGSGMKHFGKNE